MLETLYKKFHKNDHTLGYSLMTITRGILVLFAEPKVNHQ